MTQQHGGLLYGWRAQYTPKGTKGEVFKTGDRTVMPAQAHQEGGSFAGSLIKFLLGSAR